MSISEGFDGVKQEKILVAAKIDWDATTRFELLKSSSAETERFCGRPLRRGDKFPSSRLGVVTKKRAKIGKLTAIFRQLSYFWYKRMWVRVPLHRFVRSYV